jgi:hypothetical protein
MPQKGAPRLKVYERQEGRANSAARAAAGFAGFGLPQRHLNIRPPLHQASLGASEYRVLPLQRRQYFRRHHLEGVVRD